MKSREEIQADMERFIEEIRSCDSHEKAIDIDKRLDQYYANVDVPKELNLVLLSGYGEMLAMMVL